MSDDRQSSVHPFVQAQRMEQAALAQRLADVLRDADLAAMDLPPEGLALVGGGPMADWSEAQRVATAVCALLERAGLADAARVWYEARGGRSAPGRGHSWMAHERAGRVLARRVGEAMIAETEATDGE